MLLAALVAALAIATLQPAAAEDAGKTFGEGLAVVQEVKIAELIARPDEYLGKTVRVHGVVVEVCPKGGAWIDIANDADSPKIRIQVDGQVTVYPIEAKGSQLIAEGVFRKVMKTPEETKAGTARAADAATPAPDAKAVAGSPEATYEIWASGSGIKM